eukprot:2744234-Pyramimonas_sp.AAC.1
MTTSLETRGPPCPCYKVGAGGGAKPLTRTMNDMKIKRRKPRLQPISDTCSCRAHPAVIVTTKGGAPAHLRGHQAVGR